MLGGGGLTLFETRPLEDILADIADGWNSTKRNIEARELVGAHTSEYEL